MHPNTHNRSAGFEDLLWRDLSTGSAINSPLYLGFCSALAVAYVAGWGSVLLQIIAFA